MRNRIPLGRGQLQAKEGEREGVGCVMGGNWSEGVRAKEGLRLSWYCRFVSVSLDAKSRYIGVWKGSICHTVAKMMG